MEKHEQLFRMADKRFQERIAALEQSPDLATVRHEISLLRALIEDRINAAETPQERSASLHVVKDMVSVLGQLVKAHRISEIEADRLLEKEVVVKLLSGIVEIIIEEMKEVQGYELIVDRVTARLGEAVSKATNAKAKE
jgi:flagellar biosynthesis component FlhA